MTSEPPRPGRVKYVLFDVDGTLIDAVSNRRQVWGTWAERYGLDVEGVHRHFVSLREAVLHILAFAADSHGTATA
ncbi:hypothetical protein [Streptomyces macrolidinus]|uniref:hypothetical protein n=1 Tax=Streptomyces macrolidinus TaxID=2952607 RepID=UPI003555C251